MRTWRIVLGGLGVGAATFGVIEMVAHVPAQSVLRVAIWLAAALIIHDAVWSAGLIGLGALLSRAAPRGRRYLQAGLIVGGSLVAIAWPMIYLAGRQPVSKAILLQNVGANLALLVGVVAAVSAAAYAWRVIGDSNPGSRRFRRNHCA